MSFSCSIGLSPDPGVRIEFVSFDKAFSRLKLFSSMIFELWLAAFWESSNMKLLFLGAGILDEYIQFTACDVD